MRQAVRSRVLAVAAIVVCAVAAARADDRTRADDRFAAARADEPFAARPDASPFAIRGLLRDGDTAELERRLRTWSAQGDRRRLEDAWWSLRNLADGPALDAWVQASPRSVDAQLAAAIRELERASDARGQGFASSVTPSARSAMHAHAARALERTEEVLRLDPERVDAYALRIEIARLIGDDELGRRSFEAGRALDPSDYELWSKWMWGQTRRWGGSYARLGELARQAQAHVHENPRLRDLLGMPLLDLAMDLHDAGRSSDALDAYAAALEQGELVWAYRRRGRLHAQLGNHALALADFERAIELGWPQPSLHMRRGLALIRLQRREEGMAALELAAAIEPTDPTYAEVLASTQRWLADQQRWESFERNPNLSGAFEYGFRFLFDHALSGLAFALAGWALWRLWPLLRRRRTASPLPPLPPLPTGVGRGTHPELPAMVAVLLRSVLIVIVLHHVWIYGMGFASAGWVTNALDLPITAFALVGALAYASGRRLASQEIWRLWAVLFPLWNVWLHFGFGGATLAEWPAWGFTHVELLPVYGSLFAYGFAARSLWEPTSELSPSPLARA